MIETSGGLPCSFTFYGKRASLFDCASQEKTERDRAQRARTRHGGDWKQCERQNRAWHKDRLP
jgi:hypothetical protein